MKTPSNSRWWRGLPRTALVLLAVVACAGCAYFRSDRRTYQEVEQSNQEFEKQKRYRPGSEDKGWGSQEP